jgi:hypothetical protein
MCAPVLCLRALQAAHRVGEAKNYVPPHAVPDVPGAMTPTELVVAQDQGEAGARGDALPTPRLLSAAADEFFAGPQQVLVVVGESGTGKTLFTWQQAKRAVGAGWVPVVLDLKEYRVSELAGALPQHLQRCGVPEHVMNCLARGEPTSGHPDPVKLAVFCDGFDEVRTDVPADRAALRDFAGTLCGRPGAAWPAALLRMVVTTRGNAFLSAQDEAAVFDTPGGDKHARLVIAPFSSAMVSSHHPHLRAFAAPLYTSRRLSRLSPSGRSALGCSCC